MERVKTLLGRFEDDKNEELFRVLTTQVVRLYALRPAELGALLLATLAEFLVSPATSKRLVAAAMLEKMIDAIAAAEDRAPFFFDEERFAPAKWARDLEEDARPGAKGRGRALSVEELAQLDVAAAPFDQLKRVIGRRENMLYSKCETRIERREGGRAREEEDLRRIDEHVLHNENFEFEAPRGDAATRKRAKKSTGAPPAADPPQLGPPAQRPTSIPEALLALAHYLVFNPSWEVRHGGLLVFRAVVRRIAAVSPAAAAVSAERWRAEAVERVKQRCLLLLALDSFSDFLSDKTNMINRGLAAEILLLAFQLAPNLAAFANYFDFLLYQRPEHWQSKQALFYLFKQLVENADLERVRLVQTFNDQVLQREYATPATAPLPPIVLAEAFKRWALASAERAFAAHEEVTQMVLEFLGSCVRRRVPELDAAQAERLAALALGALRDTVEISFLPFAAFDFLRQLLLWGRLPPDAARHVGDLVRKFLFHDNDLVRGQIYAFLQAFFERGTAGPDVDHRFFFDALLLAFCAGLAEKGAVAALLCAVRAAAPGAAQRQMLVDLLELSGRRTVHDAIKALDAGFCFSAERNAEVDALAVVELCCEVLSRLGADALDADARAAVFARNSLAAAALLLCEAPAPAERAALLELSPAGFALAGLSARLDRLLQTVKAFFARFKADLLALAPPDVKQSINALLVAFRAEDRDRLREFYNLFVAFSAQLKQALEAGAVPSSANQIRVFLEGEVLGELREVYTAYAGYCEFCRAAAAASVVRDAAARAEPPAAKLNALVRPLLEALERPLSPFFAARFCEGLFGLVRAYSREPRSPTAKVLDTALRRAEALPALRANLAGYVGALLRQEGQRVFEAYPPMLQILRSEPLFQALCPLVRVLPAEEPAAVEHAVLDRLRGYDFAEPPRAVLEAVFALGLARLHRGHGAVLSRFLAELHAAFRAGSMTAVAAVDHLLTAHRLDFIPFSKLFVTETIRLLTAPGPRPASVFDFFARLLTLAGLEAPPPAPGLAPELRELACAGETFLLDFRNSRNFAMDEAALARILPGGLALRAYQLEGVRWMSFLFKYGLSGALCDDMGLGKTLQTLAALALLHATLPPAERVSLVVVPPSLVYHWEKECARHVAAEWLRARVATAADCAQPGGGSQLLIVSYGGLARCPELAARRFAAVVLDEAHLIKNPRTAAFQHARQLRARVRLALTGTPIQNSVLELWSIFDFLLPEYLGAQELFRREFRALIELNLLACEVDKMELSAAQTAGLQRLHARVLPFILRREKAEVLRDLPPKIVQDIDCELAPAQQLIYDALVARDARIAAEAAAPGDGRAGGDAFFALLSRLRRVLNHPGALSPKELAAVLGEREAAAVPTDFTASGKFLALHDLLLDLGFSAESAALNLLCPHKLLIFTRCTRTLALLEGFLAGRFPGLGAVALTQALSPLQRADTVERFNAAPDAKVLLLTPRVGGLGLNLSSADVVVMVDHDFNPMNDLQAMDRAHRLGQRSTVHVYRLVARGTLEEKVLGIQRFKLAVSNTVINVENASIDNVRNADFVGNLERFAAARGEPEAGDEPPLLRALKDLELQRLWNEDEYDKEFV